MRIGEKGFFREATLRICSSLDVETFLYESFMYLRGFIPVAFGDLQAPMKSEAPFESGVGPGPHVGIQREDSLALDEIVSQHIRQVLEITGGMVGGERGAAHLLQINPSTLRKRMRKLRIPFGRKCKKN